MATMSPANQLKDIAKKLRAREYATEKDLDIYEDRINNLLEQVREELSAKFQEVHSDIGEKKYETEVRMQDSGEAAVVTSFRKYLREEMKSTDIDETMLFRKDMKNKSFRVFQEITNKEKSLWKNILQLKKIQNLQVNGVSSVERHNGLNDGFIENITLNCTLEGEAFELKITGDGKIMNGDKEIENIVNHESTASDDLYDVFGIAKPATVGEVGLTEEDAGAAVEAAGEDADKDSGTETSVSEAQPVEPSTSPVPPTPATETKDDSGSSEGGGSLGTANKNGKEVASNQEISDPIKRIKELQGRVKASYIRILLDNAGEKKLEEIHRIMLEVKKQINQDKIEEELGEVFKDLAADELKTKGTIILKEAIKNAADDTELKKLKDAFEKIAQVFMKPITEYIDINTKGNEQIIAEIKKMEADETEDLTRENILQELYENLVFSFKKEASDSDDEHEMLAEDLAAQAVGSEVAELASTEDDSSDSGEYHVEEFRDEDGEPEEAPESNVVLPPKAARSSGLENIQIRKPKLTTASPRDDQAVSAPEVAADEHSEEVQAKAPESIQDTIETFFKDQNITSEIIKNKFNKTKNIAALFDEDNILGPLYQQVMERIGDDIGDQAIKLIEQTKIGDKTFRQIAENFEKEEAKSKNIEYKTLDEISEEDGDKLTMIESYPFYEPVNGYRFVSSDFYYNYAIEPVSEAGEIEGEEPIPVVEPTAHTAAETSSHAYGDDEDITSTPPTDEEIQGEEPIPVVDDTQGRDITDAIPAGETPIAVAEPVSEADEEEIAEALPVDTEEALHGEEPITQAEAVAERIEDDIYDEKVSPIKVNINSTGVPDVQLRKLDKLLPEYAQILGIDTKNKEWENEPVEYLTQQWCKEHGYVFNPPTINELGERDEHDEYVGKWFVYMLTNETPNTEEYTFLDIIDLLETQVAVNQAGEATGVHGESPEQPTDDFTLIGDELEFSEDDIIKAEHGAATGSSEDVAIETSLEEIQPEETYLDLRMPGDEDETKSLFRLNLNKVNITKKKADSGSLSKLVHLLKLDIDPGAKSERSLLAALINAHKRETDKIAANKFSDAETLRKYLVAILLREKNQTIKGAEEYDVTESIKDRIKTLESQHTERLRAPKDEIEKIKIDKNTKTLTKLLKVMDDETIEKLVAKNDMKQLIADKPKGKLKELVDNTMVIGDMPMESSENIARALIYLLTEGKPDDKKYTLKDIKELLDDYLEEVEVSGDNLELTNADESTDEEISEFIKEESDEYESPPEDSDEFKLQSIETDLADLIELTEKNLIESDEENYRSNMWDVLRFFATLYEKDLPDSWNKESLMDKKEGGSYEVLTGDLQHKLEETLRTHYGKANDTFIDVMKSAKDDFPVLEKQHERAGAVIKNLQEKEDFDNF